MRIVLTGSLGHISRPLAERLVGKGHEVTVISSKVDRKKEIENLGATAAIGSVLDVDFLTETFRGADIVYCMIPPGEMFNKDFDVMAYYGIIGGNYQKAIFQSEVTRVVHLSSIGGNMKKDNGMLIFHHEVETLLQALPGYVSIVTLRPTSFYYNLYGFMHSIKTHGFIASNYGDDDVCPWVSPLDIAEVAAEEMDRPFTGRRWRYITSEELRCSEIASILGGAIGIEGLQWKTIPNEAFEQGLLSAGLNPITAKGLTDMYANIHNGKLLEHYFDNRPEKFGRTKMSDFAKEFAAVYHQQ